MGGGILQRQASEDLVDELVPFVHEAGNPYFDWFFGGPAHARACLGAWMRRPSSEVWIGRVTLFTLEDQIIGGLVALPGSEVQGCRTADAVAALGAVGKATIIERIKAARGVFPPVRVDAFYVSKLWLIPSVRGRGYGGRLMRQFFALGESRGFRDFQCDVWSGNQSAIRLYEACGLKAVAESRSGETSLRYVSMVREGRGHPRPAPI
jgi:ribosomal protein S18 acetylase RimI-like enzyme